MISDTSAIVFVVALVALTSFSIWLLKYRREFLLPKIYLGVSVCYSIWIIALLIMKYTPAEDSTALYILDATTNIGTNAMPSLCLLIALAFIKGWEKMPRKCLWLFAVPLISVVMVWTNPLHHLVYQNFSVVRSQLTFGPYLFFSGAYNYTCMAVGVVLMVRFMISSPTRLYLRQGIMYILGVLCPLTVSIIATLGILDLTIAATPLGFIATLFFHGIAIYQLHMLDIQPVATQQVLDGISDCYLVLSDKKLVMSMNQPFRAVFGKQYGIEENKYLADNVPEESTNAKTPIYNLLTAVDTCRAKEAGVSFEQAVTVSGDDGVKRFYYIVEVSPLYVSNKMTGYVCIFKDITALKNSMQQLESSRNRMVEQERLAFLGQMVGGLAHNLKTPIMSISGGASALENLVEESRQSLDDPEVNSDDYREIYGEMDSWLERIKESCSYMSDIITAIKGQAAHASTSEESTFTVDDLMRRVALLMRHELISNKCHLIDETEVQEDIILHGDVNNLIQVLNNLISNAIYAMKAGGGGTIVLGVKKEDEFLKIYVRDTGSGVEPRVRDRLFREMITSKGTQGTGLGLYISNAVVKGKFGGSMWVEDNPAGGAVFGLSIPFENVTFGASPAAEKEEEK